MIHLVVEDGATYAYVKRRLDGRDVVPARVLYQLQHALARVAQAQEGTPPNIDFWSDRYVRGHVCFRIEAEIELPREREDVPWVAYNENEEAWIEGSVPIHALFKMGEPPRLSREDAEECSLAATRVLKRTAENLRSGREAWR